MENVKLLTIYNHKDIMSWDGDETCYEDEISWDDDDDKNIKRYIYLWDRNDKQYHRRTYPCKIGSYIWFKGEKVYLPDTMDYVR